MTVHGKDRAISESVLVKSDLEIAGFVINVEKANGTLPTVLNGLDVVLGSR